MRTLRRTQYIGNVIVGRRQYNYGTEYTVSNSVASKLLAMDDGVGNQRFEEVVIPKHSKMPVKEPAPLKHEVDDHESDGDSGIEGVAEEVQQEDEPGIELELTGPEATVLKGRKKGTSNKVEV